MRIVFMGTPEFAVPSLERLVEGGFSPVAVVTGPDKRRGRGRKNHPTPVKVAAARLGIQNILQPESVKAHEFAEAVQQLNPDVIVVVAFRILPPAVYTTARLGAFNLHGSLLPRYRGAAPIHHAVLAGDDVTGVTTFFLKEKVDTGDMILQREMAIGPDETTGDVYDRMKELGADAVLETVRLIQSGDVPSVVQDPSLATPAPKVRKEEAQVDWTSSALQVHNHIRGYSPVPAAWTTRQGERYRLLRSRLADASGSPGEIIVTPGKLLVCCGDSAVEIVEIQPEGRRVMTGKAFILGRHFNAGDAFDVVGESDVSGFATAADVSASQKKS